ncbi:MAG: hypothetical protein ACOCXJ_07465 [Planctomycetota bacterium]
MRCCLLLLLLLGAAAEQTRLQGLKRLARQQGFWRTVWQRSRRTMRRLVLVLVPTYALMATLQYYGFFKWLALTVPGLFSFPFLPAESTAIIPAQAVSLYNGAVMAADQVAAGAISSKQAVFIILIGSLLTAPFRTLKHALPTYIAVLGPKAGSVMAVSAQVLRIIFVGLGIIALWFLWG